MNAYIITRERVLQNGLTTYKYAGISEEGPFIVYINNSPPLFFINRSTLLPTGLPIKERKPVNLQSFYGSDVDALYFRNSSDLFKTKTQLKESAIICYESDIIAEERYLMERFVHGSVELSGRARREGNRLIFINPQIKAIQYKPSFTTLSLDIETGRDGTIYSFAMHTKSRNIEEKQVLMRSNKDSIDDYIEYCSGEKRLLKRFLEEFNRQDPDIILGWHVIGFDLAFIERRLKHYNLKLTLGRDGSEVEIKQNQQSLWFCNITGRVVIDGPPTLRGAFYTYESYSLDFVANEVLKRGKDITGSGKVEEIERRFREDKQALAYYNLMDTTLVTEIFEELGLIDLTFIRAITSGLTMDRVGLSVAAFDYNMLPLLHRKGLVAPDADDMITGTEGKGGLVFIEDPGFYESIIVLDFKSLYPSIIRTFFIDPLSRLFTDENSVETPVGVKFSREKHILPDFIEELMNKRQEAKRINDPHLSQAIKILMNSFYGVMGTPLSRFYHSDLSKAITGTGQWLLNTTREYLENNGYRVIYGDTDSLFVELKEEERTEFNNSALSIMDRVNRYLQELLLDSFHVNSLLELEYEKHFKKFFLPGIRGGGGGAKKRYAGLLSKKQGDELSFTGLEFVRSDWTKLAKEFQYGLFERIFKEIEVESYIKEYIQKLQDGSLDNLLTYKKRLTKSASEYTKMVPPQVKAALLLDPTGHYRGRITYIMTTDGPKPESMGGTPDYNHYIEKQLQPIADAILPYMGKSFENIVFNKQPELF